MGSFYERILERAGKTGKKIKTDQEIKDLPLLIEKERKKRNKIITIFSLSTIVIVGGILTYKFLK
tara:strand:+ start:21 stop:215 length:195 start_codon:yes stop_codon:yes gene_type:complete